MQSKNPPITKETGKQNLLCLKNKIKQNQYKTNPNPKNTIESVRSQERDMEGREAFWEGGVTVNEGELEEKHGGG